MALNYGDPSRFSKEIENPNQNVDASGSGRRGHGVVSCAAVFSCAEDICRFLVRGVLLQLCEHVSDGGVLNVR